MTGKEIISNSHFGSVDPTFLVIATSDTVGKAQDDLAVAIDQFLAKVRSNVSQTPDMSADQLDRLVTPRAEAIMRRILGNDGRFVKIISRDERIEERAKYTEMVNAIRGEARRTLSIVKFETANK